MAEINKPDMSDLWAQAGAVLAPTPTKIQTGWTAEIPPHQWENWVQRRQDEAIKYIFQHGIPVWDSITEYFAGRSVVQYSGVIYVSINNSVDSAPGGADWKPLTAPASTTVDGLIKLATNSEVQTGTDATKAVTPAGLSSRTATDTRTGLIELATSTEAALLVDSSRAITPATLSSALTGTLGVAMRSGRLLRTSVYTRTSGNTQVVSVDGAASTSTGAGTWTPHAETKFIRLTATGAGGSGGSAQGTGAGMLAAGGGGGAGGTGILIMSVPASQTITVGIGGAPNSPGLANGAVGGTTSFGSLFTAIGGNGGAGGAVRTVWPAFTTGAQGGGTSVTTVGLTMSGGNGSIGVTWNSGQVNGGAGGSSFWGAGGRESGDSNNGNASPSHGGGGSGGSSLPDNTGGSSGGKGGGGVIVVEEYS